MPLSAGIVALKASMNTAVTGEFKAELVRKLKEAVTLENRTEKEYDFETETTVDKVLTGVDRTFKEPAIVGTDLGNYTEQKNCVALADAVCSALIPMLETVAEAIVNSIKDNLTVTVNTADLSAAMQFVMPAIPASPAPLIPIVPLVPITGAPGIS